MDLSITLDQLIALGMFCITLMGFSFGVIKFFSVQIHGRINKIESDFKDKVKHIEEHYAQNADLNNSVNSIRDILRDMKEDSKRMNDRIDSLISWLMEKSR